MDIASADVKRKQRVLRKAFLENDLFIKSFQLNCAVCGSSSINFTVLDFGQYIV